MATHITCFPVPKDVSSQKPAFGLVTGDHSPQSYGQMYAQRRPLSEARMTGPCVLSYAMFVIPERFIGEKHSLVEEVAGGVGSVREWSLLALAPEAPMASLSFECSWS